MSNQVSIHLVVMELPAIRAVQGRGPLEKKVVNIVQDVTNTSILGFITTLYTANAAGEFKADGDINCSLSTSAAVRGEFIILYCKGGAVPDPSNATPVSYASTNGSVMWKPEQNVLWSTPIRFARGAAGLIWNGQPKRWFTKTKKLQKGDKIVALCIANLGAAVTAHFRGEANCYFRT